MRIILRLVFQSSFSFKSLVDRFGFFFLFKCIHNAWMFLFFFGLVVSSFWLFLFFYSVSLLIFFIRVTTPISPNGLIPLLFLYEVYFSFFFLHTTSSPLLCLVFELSRCALLMFFFFVVFFLYIYLFLTGCFLCGCY